MYTVLKFFSIPAAINGSATQTQPATEAQADCDNEIATCGDTNCLLCKKTKQEEIADFLKSDAISDLNADYYLIKLCELEKNIKLLEKFSTDEKGLIYYIHYLQKLISSPLTQEQLSLLKFFDDNHFRRQLFSLIKNDDMALIIMHWLPLLKNKGYANQFFITLLKQEGVFQLLAENNVYVKSFDACLTFIETHLSDNFDEIIAFLSEKVNDTNMSMSIYFTQSIEKNVRFLHFLKNILADNFINDNHQNLLTSCLHIFAKFREDEFLVLLKKLKLSQSYSFNLWKVSKHSFLSILNHIERDYVCFTEENMSQQISLPSENPEKYDMIFMTGEENLHHPFTSTFSVSQKLK